MLSTDALIFGFGYLKNSRSKLSFGGDGAEMAITERASNALNELITKGYAQKAKPDDQIPNREHYIGTTQEPQIGDLLRTSGIDPFDKAHSWVTFAAKA